jgi:hypothetical protein
MKIIISTTGSPTLHVMKSSVFHYAKGVQLCVWEGKLGNFGDDYNAAIEAFAEGDESFIIANDDVVITPQTMSLLLDDVAALSKVCKRIGFIAARSDFVRPPQNIRVPRNEGDAIEMCRWRSEDAIKPVDVISPIFTWVNAKAMKDHPFPPINWFSDDVVCADMAANGYKHFVSRAYVHHAGSMTVGRDAKALIGAAAPWIVEHRPEYAKKWFGVQA